MLLVAVLLCHSGKVRAQEDEGDRSVVTRAIVEGSDTLPIIELPEVRVYEKKDFDYLYLKRRYRRMIHNIKKAYPYARNAGERLAQLDKDIR